MVVLKGMKVQLRPASLDDAEARLALGTDVDIGEMFGISRSDVRPMTRDGASQWAQKLAENPYAWIIEIEGRLIGEIRLHNLDVRDRRASMAIGLYDPTLLGKGVGSEAIRLLIQHAFVQLKLHRIGIRVLAYNTRAIRAYEKCGFVVEGRERETAFVNGTWHDDLMMGLLASEFQT
ncbi:GNAT family N-acetyltransferase [Rhizobium mongolense]|uniref:GNAT family N-acetyltransferase n=1 Tax=Rhizobium mongolense TaxID=57676 RepID=UPI0035565CC4